MTSTRDLTWMEYGGSFGNFVNAKGGYQIINIASTKTFYIGYTYINQGVLVVQGGTFRTSVGGTHTGSSHDVV